MRDVFIPTTEQIKQQLRDTEALLKETADMLRAVLGTVGVCCLSAEHYGAVQDMLRRVDFR